ncbi:hypothetical protein ABPG77_010301 [Micractinium sp. CCAP 211/92]
MHQHAQVQVAAGRINLLLCALLAALEALFTSVNALALTLNALALTLLSHIGPNIPPPRSTVPAHFRWHKWRNLLYEVSTSMCAYAADLEHKAGEVSATHALAKPGGQHKGLVAAASNARHCVQRAV